MNILRIHTSYIYTFVSVSSKYLSFNSKNINEKEIDGLHFDITLDTVNPDVGYDCLHLIHEWDINLNLFFHAWNETVSRNYQAEMYKSSCQRLFMMYY